MQMGAWAYGEVIQACGPRDVLYRRHPLRASTTPYLLRLDILDALGAPGFLGVVAPALHKLLTNMRLASHTTPLLLIHL